MNLLRNFEQLSRETPNNQLHRTRKRQAKRRTMSTAGARAPVER